MCERWRDFVRCYICKFWVFSACTVVGRYGFYTVGVIIIDGMAFMRACVRKPDDGSDI